MSGQTSKDVCIAFLDIRRAFDNLGHEHLKKHTAIYRNADCLRETDEAMNDNLSTVVKIGTTKTQSIAVRRGVLQGDPLSPLLFNMCIDIILKKSILSYSTTITDTLAAHHSFICDVEHPYRYRYRTVEAGE